MMVISAYCEDFLTCLYITGQTCWWWLSTTRFFWR